MPTSGSDIHTILVEKGTGFLECLTSALRTGVLVYFKSVFVEKMSLSPSWLLSIALGFTAGLLLHLGLVCPSSVAKAATRLFGSASTQDWGCMHLPTRKTFEGTPTKFRLAHHAILDPGVWTQLLVYVLGIAH